MADISSLSISPAGIFQRTELNEPLLLLYTMVRRMFADGSDTVTVTPAQMSWSRDGQIMHDFPFHPDATPPFHRQFATMVERDPVIREHVREIASDGTTTTYRVTLD